MRNQLKTVENKLKELKHFKHGSELTIDIDLSGLTDKNLDEIAGFFEFKKHHKAWPYLKRLQAKYNK